jgi:hypothetical protein
MAERAKDAAADIFWQSQIKLRAAMRVGRYAALSQRIAATQGDNSAP